MNLDISLQYFYLLKKEVETKYKSKHPACAIDIHQWRGEDIQLFQDDLLEELNERLSERWFYTHIKPKENEKLPRIDMLNILSRYAAYKNWDEFKYTHQDISKNHNEVKSNHKSPNNIKVFRIILLITLLVLLGIAFKDSIIRKEVYTFCFYDHDSNKPISNPALEIIIINEHESPLIIHNPVDACFETKTHKESMKFIVKAPYYKTDTIERYLNKSNSREIVKLRPDDYALMIHLFSTSDIKDWSKRRKQLDAIILDEAVIFQISKDEAGMEMYNKTEFIDKMTMPIESLRNIEIIETIYAEGKIKKMRFTQK